MNEFLKALVKAIVTSYWLYVIIGTVFVISLAISHLERQQDMIDKAGVQITR